MEDSLEPKASLPPEQLDVKPLTLPEALPPAPVIVDPQPALAPHATMV